MRKIGVFGGYFVIFCTLSQKIREVYFCVQGILLQGLVGFLCKFLVVAGGAAA